MKILIVSPVYWPESFRVNDLSAAWVERGYEVEVLAGMPNYPEGKFFEGYGWKGPWEEAQGGVRILRFPVIPRGRGRGWELLLHYGTWLVGAFARLLGNCVPDWDVIFVFQSSPVTVALPALLARRLSGAPTVIWVQDLWPDVVRASGLIRHPWLLAPIGWLSRRLYLAFDRVVAQSAGFQEALRGQGVSPERLSCVHNWAEEIYSGAPPASHEGDEPWRKGFVVLFAGNLGRMQGLPTLLAAATLLKGELPVKWVLIGDGSLAEWLREEITARGLEDCVWMLGRHPVDRMPEFFAKADALLLSLNRDEALALTVPSKLQSYLASGRPVIGSVDGEAARVIRESGAGVVAPAEDPVALAEVVRRLAGLEEAERAVLGQAGRAYYERTFHRDRCVGALDDMLVDLAGGSGVSDPPI